MRFPGATTALIVIRKDEIVGFGFTVAPDVLSFCTIALSSKSALKPTLPPTSRRRVSMLTPTSAY